MNHRTREGESYEPPPNYIAHINGVCPCEKCRELKRKKEQKKESVGP